MTDHEFLNGKGKTLTNEFGLEYYRHGRKLVVGGHAWDNDQLNRMFDLYGVSGPHKLTPAQAEQFAKIEAFTR